MKRILILFLWLLSLSAEAQLMLRVADLTELRTKVGSKGQMAKVVDGSGDFYWVDGETMADNSTNVIKATNAAVGRWLLEMPPSGFLPVSTSVVSGTATGEIELCSKVIKGNTLGTSRSISYLFTFEISSGILLLPNLTFKIKYGGASLTIIDAAIVSASLTSRVVVVQGRLAGFGATNKQYIYGRMDQDVSIAGLPVAINGSTAIKHAKWTVDSSIDQTFSITVQPSLTMGSAVIYPTFANLVFL